MPRSSRCTPVLLMRNHSHKLNWKSGSEARRDISHKLHSTLSLPVDRDAPIRRRSPHANTYPSVYAARYCCGTLNIGMTLWPPQYPKFVCKNAPSSPSASSESGAATGAGWRAELLLVGQQLLYARVRAIRRRGCARAACGADSGTLPNILAPDPLGPHACLSLDALPDGGAAPDVSVHADGVAIDAASGLADGSGAPGDSALVIADTDGMAPNDATPAAPDAPDATAAQAGDAPEVDGDTASGGSAPGGADGVGA